MASEVQPVESGVASAVRELRLLRQFAGAPKEFWSRLATCLADLSGAPRVVIAARQGTPEPAWRRLADLSRYSGPAWINQAFSRQLDGLDGSSLPAAPVSQPLEDPAGRPTEHHLLLLPFDVDGATEHCIGLFLLVGSGPAKAGEILQRLGLAADTPRLYLLARSGVQAREDVQKLATVLDLMVEVNSEKRFLASAMAFVNGLAARFECDRVSLGWLQGGYIRLRAVSRMESFNRRMAAATALEKVMEEALDQDEDLVFPPPDGVRLVCRDHEQYAAEQRVPHLASFPIRDGTQPAAVVTLERAGRPFTATELQQVRLAGDMVARRLVDLRRLDRWFGARWAEWLRENLGRVVGPEHTWVKLLTLLITTLLAVVFFVRVNYRVEGGFKLRSDETAYLTAPYDGFLKEALVRPGDVLPQGQPLLRLNTEELELEETAAVADLNRYRREAEKARAGGALADMRVAEALARQAEARLDLIRHRLGQASLRAPFDGVVVEGDLRERLGAPVRQGDALLQVARLDALYVEAQISERDVHEVLGRETGEIAFVTQPQRKFPVRIERIEPAAVTDEGENVFLVRCAPLGPPEAWWRPGMTGVCKLNVGPRTLAWILTHRTVDFLRLLLWW